MSVTNYSLEEVVRVYPNPTNGNLKISSIKDLRTAKIELYNLLGRSVYTAAFSEEIDISSLRAGVYLLSINLDGERLVNKRIILY